VTDGPTDNHQRSPRPATLADVGALAGVSSATASRVLNGDNRRVAEHLRVRVLAAAEQLDYVPNAHAQALMRVETHTVGVLTLDMNNPYFVEVFTGIFSVAKETGRLVTLGNTGADRRDEVSYIALLRSQRVGALILTGTGTTDAAHTARMRTQISGFRGAGGRVSLIGRHDIEGDAVRPDNVGGARAAATALLDLGHRQVGIISGTEITAVFCVNDAMAIGAMGLLRERGIDVPGRMSVVGFEDIVLAREVTPALSTVHVPMAEMGESAMRLLLEPSHEAPRTVRFPTRLCLRGTTASPR
jgi:LacI family transcriptional regulator